MKKLLLFLPLLALSTLLLQAEPEATKDKITRDEAQHIALREVPNGSVKSAELKRENGRGVWEITIAKGGSNTVTEIRVDAMSGHVVPAAEPSSPAEGVKH